MMALDSKIYIAGHRGLVGSALVRSLKSKGYSNLLYRTSKELDLTNQEKVAEFMATERPDYVFLAAAKVGGIMANNVYPAEFIYQNLQIQNNLIHQAYLNGVKKLLFLGSVCIYPKICPQPIKEEYLLSGYLESTNEPYAIAKIAGLKMCQSYNRQYGTNFLAVMPTNLYGPGDNFDLQTSHVLPAMIRKFHEAKLRGDTQVTLWGTGSVYREFLYVDDMADGCVTLMNEYEPGVEQLKNGDMLVNLGVGYDLTIKDLAELVKKIVGFDGEIIWDSTKPDGTPKRTLDISKISNIWRHKIDLEEGIDLTYKWFKENYS